MGFFLNYEELFIKSIQESYQNVCLTDIRSNSRVYPIHKVTAECVQKELIDFKVISLGVGDNKEYNYLGGCQSLKLDQAVLYYDEPVSGISLKNIMGNYKQNSHNYVVSMLGETAIVKEGGLKYGYIIVLPQFIPYYSNKYKRYMKLEKISNENIETYYNIFCRNTSQYSHKPDIFNMMIIDTGVNDIYQHFIENKIEIVDRNKFLKEYILPNLNITKVNTDNVDYFNLKTKSFLNQYSDYNQFIKSYCDLTKSSVYGKIKVTS